jgi:hypothetical protein
MRPSVFRKQPWEERRLEFDVSSALNAGDSVSSLTSVTVLLNGVAQSAMLGVASVVGNKVYALIKGGTHGLNYDVQVRVATTNGEKIEDDLMLEVRDLPSL